MSEHLPNLHYLDPELLQKLGDLEIIAREAVEGLREESRVLALELGEAHLQNIP